MPFMGEDFLLEGKTAKELYHGTAAKLPIIDYHCHVPPKDIALDVRFKNITEAWLYGDHYKWRLMRARGVEEKYVTGDASDREKFQKFAETLPYAIGNPVYHWAHLELKRYFDCDLVLCPQNAEEIWEVCSSRLAEDDMSARGIIRKSNVTHICTTDDPIDSLEWHKEMYDDPAWDVKVLPAFRPDKAININKPGFLIYINALAQASSIAINNLDDLYAALSNRIDYFHSMGCKTSDHGLDYFSWTSDCEDKARIIFAHALSGEAICKRKAERFKAAIMLFLAREYSKRNWVMQIHYGAVRNVNSFMFKKLGPDTGFDNISSMDSSEAMYRLLDGMNAAGNLPKTILYSLNPNDDALLASAIGSFQSEGQPGKMQHGSAWWFNDTKTGMIQQMTNLANIGVLGNFVGMLTDSRSFLSYPRHEYFRRILCNLIGGWVDAGEYPNDKEFLETLVKDICYHNAMRYMGFETE